jgi:hypothetical protein
MVWHHSLKILDQLGIVGALSCCSQAVGYRMELSVGFRILQSAANREPEDD